MSIKVMNWVWEHSGATGGDLLVLLAIADHAADDGTNAFPLVDTLAGKCRTSPRSIQRAVSRLTKLGELRVERNEGGLADTPVDRRPNRYTVLMRPPVDNSGRGDTLSPRHPVDNPERGDSADATGVTHVTQRGDSAVTHNRPGTVPEPPPAPAPAREGGTLPVDNHHDGGGGGSSIERFFAELGAGWRLSASQRGRLASRVEAALASGWGPGELAAYVGANTAGVRNQYAVLRARLDDLPDPPREAAGCRRPPWCGTCLEATRMVEDSDGRPSRCPRCHPLQATQGPPAAS